jgi:hypothetical protein
MYVKRAESECKIDYIKRGTFRVFTPHIRFSIIMKSKCCFGKKKKKSVELSFFAFSMLLIKPVGSITFNLNLI